jgi:hypothetical protein
MDNQTNKNRDSRFRITISELLLLTLIAALAIGWWIDHGNLERYLILWGGRSNNQESQDIGVLKAQIKKQQQEIQALKESIGKSAARIEQGNAANTMRIP